MRKILYISGTRADYGLMRPVLFAIKKHPGLKIEIVATGMHLMPEFGRTIKEVIRDGFKVYSLFAVYRDDTPASMVNFCGEFILKLNRAVAKIKPDAILILGDRLEMLAAAIVGAYRMIPVAHIHGGDATSTVDEFARHAISKLSHLHFAVTPNSAKRILAMGEEPWRVHVVGAPGLDDILHEELISKASLAKRYGLDLSAPMVLVVQHPVTLEIKQAALQMRRTMEAVKEFAQQAIVVYPNADAGGRAMIRVIEQYRKYPFIKIYQTIPRKDYLSLMKIAGVIVGNSSSGIIEAPSFHLPVVNIGSRQSGREKAENVIEVGYDKNQIRQAIKKAIYDKKFRKRVTDCKSPYGDGQANKRIVSILSNLKVDEKLLQKRSFFKISSNQ